MGLIFIIILFVVTATFAVLISWVISDREMHRILNENYKNERGEDRMISYCSNCLKEVEPEELCWTYRFGYPFKKVCEKCKEEIDRESETMEFDPMYAGERLEDDY